MKKAVLFASFPAAAKYLTVQGWSVLHLAPADIHSLTALLMADPDIRDMLLPGSDLPWSQGHILAAAKLLRTRGGQAILVGGDSLPWRDVSMIRFAASEAEAVNCLASPPAAKQSTEQTAQAVRPPKPQPLPAEAVSKLQIPGHKHVIWNVVGAQSRIGCTTQAIALCHYCRALGFSPAVVMPPEKLRVLADFTGTGQAGGIYRIQGVCFTSAVEGSFDCFIRDLGSPTTLPAADATVLVAGCKPWELGSTVAALQRLPRLRLAAILSFSTSEAARELLPLFGGVPVMVAGYLPDPWKITQPALSYYDRYLRPIAEQLCNEKNESEELTNVI